MLNICQITVAERYAVCDMYTVFDRMCVEIYRIWRINNAAYLMGLFFFIVCYRYFFCTFSSSDEDSLCTYDLKHP